VRDWSVRAKKIGFTALIAYIPIISFLIARGAAVDQSFERSELYRKTGLVLNNASGIEIHYFISFLLVYAIRVGVLFALFAYLPILKKYTMLKTVVLACLLPELLLLILTFPKQQPTNPGPFTANGWVRLGYFMVVAMSCILQLIAMLVGTLRQPAITNRKTV
jgi:hypothetical protein